MSRKTMEKNLWAWLLKGARGNAHITAHRIENTLARSTPDVAAAIGSVMVFIELKTTHRPVRPSTPIRPRFQPGQTDFLHHWSTSHNVAFLLLQVGSGPGAHRYLLRGSAAGDIEAGECTEADLQKLAILSSRASAEDIFQAAAQDTWLMRF